MYLLSPKVAQIFHSGRIPRIVVTPALLDLCQNHAQSPDHGKAFFYEFAAKQMAIVRGLGYSGAHLGGVHSFESVESILKIEQTFSVDDWRQFVHDIQFSGAGEFFFYAHESGARIADAAKRTATSTAKTKHPLYTFSGWVHGVMFTPGRVLNEWGELNMQKRTASRRQTPEAIFQAARQRVEKLIPLGIAAVRDAGDKDSVGLSLSKLYMTGKTSKIPYVDSPGAAIHHRRQYGSLMAEAVEEHRSPRDCVMSRLRGGADRIKLIATDIVDFAKGEVTRQPQMTAEEITEFVRVAKESSMPWTE